MAFIFNQVKICLPSLLEAENENIHFLYMMQHTEVFFCVVILVSETETAVCLGILLHLYVDC